MSGATGLSPMHDELLSLLLALDGIRQDPRYHPEGDALFHTLQVFGLALRETREPALLAAALLHDVGKASAGADHDEVGADLIDGLLVPRVVWLVRHHLDLLRHPRRARHRRTEVGALQQLRRWDLGGRDPRARVMSPEAAVAVLLDHPSLFDRGDAAHDHEVPC